MSGLQLLLSSHNVLTLLLRRSTMQACASSLQMLIGWALTERSHKDRCSGSSPSARSTVVGGRQGCRVRHPGLWADECRAGTVHGRPQAALCSPVLSGPCLTLPILHGHWALACSLVVEVLIMSVQDSACLQVNSFGTHPRLASSSLILVILASMSVRTSDPNGHAAVDFLSASSEVTATLPLKGYWHQPCHDIAQGQLYHGVVGHHCPCIAADRQST